jgi:hypothetical protein
VKEDGVLGIIGCPILEDEVIYAIERDADVQRVYVVDNQDARNLLRKMDMVLRKPPIMRVGIDQLGSIDDDEGFRILVLMKSVALHEEPQRLRKEVLAAIEEIAPHCRSILLFYGLCGNAFRESLNVSTGGDRPVHILCDEEGRTVDDCIAAVLGGTDGYLRLLKRYPGVFYLTPAWAENWQEMMGKMEITRGMDPGDLSTLKWLFDLAGYQKALKLDTGLGDRDIYEGKVDEFVRTFNFEKGELEKEFLTLDVIDKSYAKAKNGMNGGEGTH